MKKETVLNLLFFVAVGALAGIGVRIAEWVIPAPESRVVICMADDLGNIPVCERLGKK